MNTRKLAPEAAAAVHRCPQCGEPLPAHLPPARCPRCLLRQGLPTNEPAEPAETATPGNPGPPRAFPAPGAIFGHYRIARLLGEGGMGAVFEAEDLDSGRRVALKLLGHRIDSPEARHRFFREGRLAAAVNHPNSVYVFGTEEIAGVPAIAMEWVAGGTLRDRVSRHGPLPVGEAVDCLLQAIAGLEAARRVGILHRDIKPSNCFIETDGSVKIGDFGLSISTFIRTEPALTATGAFLGTPAYASPEQLRGDELTVRSDIYSVGVTLYYLLTAHHPFEASDLVRLMAAVLERPAPSPAQWRAELPAGLCRAALRCLEKDPERRFRAYDDLRHALLPFASSTPMPASLGRRFLAGGLDDLLLSLPFLVLGVYGQSPTADAGPSLIPHVQPVDLGQVALVLAYFGVCEGLWGASLGKFLFGLRVVGRDRTCPGAPRALLRAFLFKTLPQAAWLALFSAGSGALNVALTGTWLAGLGLLKRTIGLGMFVTARQFNGFAGLHDLLSGTRVIAKSRYLERPSLPRAEETSPTTEDLPRIGPYHVLDRLDRTDGAEWLLGFDTCLLRRVWIRKLAPGTDPVAPSLRGLRRPGRLRWLAGQRTDAEAWDAYEAPSGQPLLDLFPAAQPWERVRHWLLDLGEELGQATPEGSSPAVLELDRVWITAEGRAKLLDFPAPRTGSRPATPHAPDPREACTPPAFLRRVALSALTGREVDSLSGPAAAPQVPLPLHASRFLDTLTTAVDLPERMTELQSLLRRPARVSRALRAGLLTGAMIVPLLAGWVAGALHTRSVALASEKAALRWHLAQHEALESGTQTGGTNTAVVLEALETYLLGRFAPLLTNATQWNSDGDRRFFSETLHARADRIRAHRPLPSSQQLAAAAVQLRGVLPNPAPAESSSARLFTVALAASLGVYVVTAAFVVLPCLLGSILFGGGLLVKLLDLVYVTRAGVPASRGRVAARNLLAWTPFLLQPAAVFLLAPLLGPAAALSLVASLCVGLTLLSLLRPNRSLADPWAGTWLVPR